MDSIEKNSNSAARSLLLDLGREYQQSMFTDGNNKQYTVVSPEYNAQYRQSLKRSSGPASLEDMERARREAMSMDFDEALLSLRAVGRRLSEEDRARMPDIIRGGSAVADSFYRKKMNVSELLTSPEFMRVFGDNIEDVNALERVWYSTWGALWLGGKRGAKNLHLGREAYLNTGDFSDPEFQQRMAARAAELADDELFIDSLNMDSWWLTRKAREFLVNAGDTFGGMGAAALTPEAAAAAATGAGVGAALGGVGAGPGALSGLMSGVSGVQGMSSGGATAWEMYQAMPEEMKDEDMAIRAGIAVALPSIILERIGLGGMAKGTGPVVRKAASNVFKKYSPKAAARVERAMASKTFEGVAARLAVNATAHTAPEILTEAVQSGPIEVGAQMWGAERYNQQYARKGYSMDVPTADDLIKAALAGAWQAAWGGAGAGLIRPGFQALREATNIKANQELDTKVKDAAEKLNLPPDIVDKGVKAALGVLRVDAVNKSNDKLRAGVKSATEKLRQIPAAKDAPDVVSDLLLKQTGETEAFASSEALYSLFQNAMDDPAVNMDYIASDFLAPLGVSRDQFFEALDNASDVSVDLSAIPQVMNNPLWDEMADLLTVEPVAVTSEIMDNLNALYESPPRLIPNPMDEVRPETRKELVEALVAGGRTRAQANAESEFAVRMAANITRSTGESVEAFLTERLRIGREGDKKSREWAGSVGLQLPPGGTPSKATLGNKVYHHDDFVNLAQPVLQLRQDVFGEEFADFSGRPVEAIEHLMREQRGFVPGAFYREELGDIDLPWGKGGKKGFGLAHIIERRNKDGFDGEAFVRALPEIINNGRIERRDKYPGRAFIVSDEREAIVRLEWDGEKRSWLLTAYPFKSQKGPLSSERTTDLVQTYDDGKAPSSNSTGLEENTPEALAGFRTYDQTFGDEQRFPPSHSEGVENSIDELFEKDNTLFQENRGHLDIFADGIYRVIFTESADASFHRYS